MSDLSVGDFRARFAQAAGLDTPAEEETPVEEADTVEPDESDVEQQQEPEEEPGERLLANKYKSVEELERAYQEAQTALGRQGNELSELRSLTQQVGALREQLDTPAQPGYSPDYIEEYLATNPHLVPAIAQQALTEGNNDTYRQAMAAWTALDPVGAMDFHARALTEHQLSQLRAELAPALQGMQQTQTRDQFEQAFETKKAEHEDFAQVIGSITDQSLESFPTEILGVLQTGDQASKERVLETLYRWVKAEQAGNLTVAAQAAARQSAEESRQARQQAAVATPGSSQTREPVAGVDAWREAFRGSDVYRKAAGQV